MKKIQITSHLLSLLFRGACWIYPIIYSYCIFFRLDEMMAWTQSASDNAYDLSNLSLGHHLVILAIACIPLSITVFICHQLAKLFRLYEQGYLFELENIKLIKSVGICMISSELIQFIYQPLMTYALTFYKPAGEHMISWAFGTTNVTTLITGFVILMASWIAGEAHALKTDVQLTI